MPPRQTPSSSSSRPRVNLHTVALSAILFLIGIQFTTLLRLFDAGDADADPDAWWARDRDDLGRGRPLAGEGRRPPRWGKPPLGRPKDEKTAPTGPRRPRRGRGRPKAEMAAPTGPSRPRRRRGGGEETEEKSKKSQRFHPSNYENDFESLPWTLPEPTPLRDQTSEEFMADYIAAKRRAGIPLPWEQKELYAEKPVSLPLPIISLNLPKSATLTMQYYFLCGGLTAIHTSTQHGRIGVCMLENHAAGRPPLEGCDTHEVRRGGRHPHEGRRGEGYKMGALVPIDVVSDIGLQGPPCYYPSLHDGGLEQIAEHYPNATILMVVRDADGWRRSMSRWGNILKRWRRHCGFDGSLHEGGNMDHWKAKWAQARRGEGRGYWVDFYRAHTQKAREFAMRHHSLTYVEAELGDDLGEVLGGYTGVEPSCVMDCHPGPRWVKTHNTTDRCHPVGEAPALLEGSGGGEGDERIGSGEEDEGSVAEDEGR